MINVIALTLPGLYFGKKYFQSRATRTPFSYLQSPLGDERPYALASCHAPEKALPIGRENADLLFLGDSLIAQHDWLKDFPGSSVVNHGINNDLTDCVLYRLSRSIALKPKKIVLLIGVNDLFKGRSVEATANVEWKIVASLRQSLPETRIVLLSNLPTAALADQIERLNDWKRKTALDLGAEFIDVYGKLASERKLNSKFDLGDGLHLNQYGYDIVVDALKRGE